MNQFLFSWRPAVGENVPQAARLPACDADFPVCASVSPQFVSYRQSHDGMTCDTCLKKACRTLSEVFHGDLCASLSPLLYILYLYCYKCHRRHCPIGAGVFSVTDLVTLSSFPDICHPFSIFQPLDLLRPLRSFVALLSFFCSSHLLSF